MNAQTSGTAKLVSLRITVVGARKELEELCAHMELPLDLISSTQLRAAGALIHAQVS